MRSFVVVGQTAFAGDDFLFDDLPGTSGRLDVLARAVRATLLVSHGVRKDTQLYLVLLGGPKAPRTLRITGAEAMFLRPDERSSAVLFKKRLAREGAPEFTPPHHGISLANAGIEAVVADLGGARRFVLDENAPDVRDVVPTWDDDVAFLLGDHKGIDPAARAAFEPATTISIGPLSLHTEDAIAVLANELDRAAAKGTR